MEIGKYNVDDKLSQLKRYLEWGDNIALYKESCALLESILRTVYAQTLSKLSYDLRKKLTITEEEIGRGKKGYEDFSFGELVGLYRKTNLLNIIESTMKRELGLLKAFNLDAIVKLRNELTHDSINTICTRNDAKLIYEYLINWLAYLGYANMETAVQNSTLNFSKAALNNKANSEVLIDNPIAEKKKVASIYSSSYGNEKNRLEIQALNTEQIDRNALNRAMELLSNKEHLSVIDIGCSSGIVTHNRFDQYQRIEKVIGIDFNEEQINSAKQRNYPSRYVFYVVDIESDDFEKNLTSIIEKEQIDKFDIVFSALTLHHLKDPIKLLKRIRKFIAKDGILILRGSDDGTKLAYPDEGLVNNIIRMTLNIQGVSDRLNGRKLYYQAYCSGYHVLEMLYNVKDTTKMTFDDRQNIFEESFKYRKDYFRKRLAQDSENDQFKTELMQMEEMLDELEERFGKPDFYYSEIDYLIIAKVN